MQSLLFLQDILEVTPVSHVDRVPLQLALTQLECLAELINSRRKEGEMKSQLKYLDTQISQLNKVGCIFTSWFCFVNYQIR
jgi:Rho guanine nucleotide exchange factor 10